MDPQLQPASLPAGAPPVFPWHQNSDVSASQLVVLYQRANLAFARCPPRRPRAGTSPARAASISSSTWPPRTPQPAPRFFSSPPASPPPGVDGRNPGCTARLSSHQAEPRNASPGPSLPVHDLLSVWPSSSWKGARDRTSWSPRACSRPASGSRSLRSCGWSCLGQPSSWVAAVGPHFADDQSEIILLNDVLADLHSLLLDTVLDAERVERRLRPVDEPGPPLDLTRASHHLQRRHSVQPAPDPLFSPHSASPHRLHGLPPVQLQHRAHCSFGPGTASSIYSTHPTLPDSTYDSIRPQLRTSTLGAARGLWDLGTVPPACETLVV